jgi:voltage-gated potassium channel
VSSEEATEKFLRAGADRVFLPYKTGGRRMAQGLMRPEVDRFLDAVLHDEDALGLLLENLTVEEGSALDGKTLAETRIRQRTGVTVVGLKRRDTGILPNLQASTVFQTGDTIFAVGTRRQLGDLEPMARASKY